MLIATYALIFAGTWTASAAATEAAQRPDSWISYQGLTYSRERARTETGVIEDHGDGFIPQFRIRVRGLPQAAASQARAPIVDIEPNAGTASEDAGLLLRIAVLDLPQGTGGASSDYFRSNRAWRWRHERIGSGAREVAADVDLLAEPNSRAAEVCRMVAVSTVPGLSSDRCRIEAIIDLADGWPLTAEVTRTLAGASGSTAFQTVTFERLPSR